MITVMDSRMNNAEKCLDSQLWHACAGSMVQIPSLNSKVFYFPQGHAEHANENVDFGNLVIPSLILCRISGIKFMAEPETDEVYAKIMLVPLRESEFGYEDGFDGGFGVENGEKPASFAKTLTQSDANNGGGFSVPRYCADTIFPRLDYNAEPPVQTIHVKDVHGDVWKFRHIYRGTPRRHLLTTGWSSFVNRKKLVAGDSIVFHRGENGDLCVGIRRAKRGIGSGHEYPSWWNSGDPRGRIRSEHVIEAATRAAKGEPFEVVYYPRASSPEFCVKASSVRGAMRTNWYPGMRFKMAFETEDSSRISWFMGTIANAHVVDPIRWSNSPWRLLQVAWDEPDLLHDVKRVSPWLVELATNIPTIHLDRFSPPRKKTRLPQQADLSLLDQIRMPPFLGNSLRSSSPVCCVTDNVPGGIQGARHAQYGLSSSDLQFPLRLHQLNHTAPTMGQSRDYGNDGNPTRSSKESNETKAPHILLFGQIIFIEQQGSQSCSDTIGNSSSDGIDGSGSALHQNARENSSDEGSPRWKELQRPDVGLENGQCKVFMESENVGRTLDLSVLRSYEELHSKLANMFDAESSDLLSGVLYRDAYGSIKHTGDEPFSEFTKTARKLTVLTDSGSDNIGR